jgi:hypothetical protein
VCIEVIFLVLLLETGGVYSVRILEAVDEFYDGAVAVAESF